MSRKRLTLKQDRFVKEYIKDGNAKKAVREAYPNIKTENARCVMGAKLVRNGNVQERIQEVLDEAGLTPELIVGELLGLIRGEDMTEKNKAIRTAAEIMGLIGKGGIMATQVNIDQKPLFGEWMGKPTMWQQRKTLEDLVSKYQITNADFIAEVKKELIDL